MHTDRTVGLDKVTYDIIAAAYRVQNVLGAGFLEKIYENAMALELGERGLAVEPQVAYEVMYRGQPVGRYIADLVVERAVVVEIKACAAIDPVHKAQCLNYLKASGLGVGLVLNFGRPRIEIRRLRLH